MQNLNKEKKETKTVSLEKQFLALVHVYMCNTVVCVYSNRSPSHITEIVDSPHFNVFGFGLPKVQSIIRPISSKLSHGWLRVDVFLTNPTTVLERWYFIHTPLPSTQTPEMSDKLKYELYHKIKTLTRSIQSLITCMPTETLILNLSHIKQTDLLPESKIRNIKVELTPLTDFPVVEPNVPNSNTFTLRDLITPFGTCSVRCVYNTKLESLLPRTFHISIPKLCDGRSKQNSPHTPTDRSQSSSSEWSELILQQSEYQRLQEESQKEEIKDYKAPEKLPDILNDSNEALDSMIYDFGSGSAKEDNEQKEIVPIEDLEGIIEGTIFNDKVKPLSDLKTELNSLTNDVDDVLAKWSKSG